jgi:uncharacterized protein (DUF305 family)
MKNINIDKSLLYGIIGFLVGIIITSGFCMMNHHRGWDKKDYSNKMMMQKMSDGTMMDNMGMESSMSGMMMGLEGKTGEEFDKAFLSEMIVHHEGAVDMAQMVLTTSKRPELTKLAGEIITAQTKEIRMMKDWQKSWYK